MKIEKNLSIRKLAIAKWTKRLLDFMFYAGIAATLSLPFGIKWVGQYLPVFAAHYAESLAIYAALGAAAVLLIWELRKMFRTVLREDCFVEENVISLRRMGNLSFFIAGLSVVRSIVFLTIAMAVVVLVFIIAGLFSRVLALVFEEAVRYKEENDLTI